MINSDQNFSLIPYLQDDKTADVVRTVLEIIFLYFNRQELANFRLASKMFKEIADKLETSEKYLLIYEKKWMNHISESYEDFPNQLKEDYPQLAKGKNFREIYQALNKHESFQLIRTQRALGKPSKEMKEMLGKFAFVPKEIFLKILSFLSCKDLATLTRVSKFFAYMSEKNIFWQQFMDKSGLLKLPNFSWINIYTKKNIFIAHAQAQFKQKHPGVLNTVVYEEDIVLFIDELKKAATEKYANIYSKLKFSTFNKFFKSLRGVTPEELKKLLLLEDNKRGIDNLISEKPKALIVLANEALHNVTPSIFIIFIDFLAENCLKGFYRLLENKKYYGFLHKYLSYQNISQIAERHILTAFFASSTKSFHLREFIIAFHQDFLLKRQDQIYLDENWFTPIPLHEGLLRFEECCNLFLPLIKFFENTFYKEDIFFQALFDIKNSWLVERIPQIFGQFSRKFLREYRDSEGNTLLVMAMKSKCFTAAKHLISRCPELTTIPDNDTVIKYAYSHKSPYELTNLIVKTAVVLNAKIQAEKENKEISIKRQNLSDKKSAEKISTTADSSSPDLSCTLKN